MILFLDHKLYTPAKKGMEMFAIGIYSIISLNRNEISLMKCIQYPFSSLNLLQLSNGRSNKLSG